MRKHMIDSALSFFSSRRMTHSWVVGALDASWRAVYEILWSSYPGKVKEFERMWGSDEDWTQKIIAFHVCSSLAIQGSNNDEQRDAGTRHDPMVL